MYIVQGVTLVGMVVRSLVEFLGLAPLQKQLSLSRQDGTCICECKCQYVLGIDGHYCQYSRRGSASEKQRKSKQRAESTVSVVAGKEAKPYPILALEPSSMCLDR